ncbi:Transcriptional regulators (plasmid) [Rubrobacter radiotolerans]|uniref:GntR family transcriptional regulator n=1 Tax=Rubrobacter radiotolerans TaxID=42256 RepID=A0A023X7E0_RUBRA|nr:GntR family transcriptional regulator [Rubrobacter radiotolerans]AHY48253.1 Transcriptional regulators [Rubrobacter radiotolerans]MDX5895526.1 GntR family transcriptional regulator [Rubrobacter radiotolerans]SMC01451.1 DNA-binding transcriptional regulator, GntR family [Rubrobacter radiotolerans DSM 5868]
MVKGARASGDGRSRGRLGRLEQGSLSERAYGAIRSSIISGRFAPGERLVEEALAEDLGVSRAPVREAFRKLADERLVEERPRHGTYVREFTAKDFVDIYNLLSAIESLAVRLIVREKAPLEPLRRIVDRMAEAAREGDLPRVVEIELEFHRSLCSAADNEHLDNVFRLLSGLVGMALSLDDATYEDVKDIAAEHYPLLEAIEEAAKTGEEERAVFAIRSHIRASLGEVMRRLGGDPSDVLYPLVYPEGTD